MIIFVPYSLLPTPCSLLRDPLFPLLSITGLGMPRSAFAKRRLCRIAYLKLKLIQVN
ncbi:MULTISPECIES: hypothetical protein [unclassified Moorena]|uniref:hypothetical protein n=1 Tax=unclassified Moorena TaxID=2683338 RepID=UPI0013FF31D1|nr:MULTISPECIES: hypothetical protein [unclassified Moorena]NEO17363.1 hypothetical protein [Moorena sp. SIO3E8]NEQ03935.1 hypothetical protein [Moorena sp. SIO3F7]